MSIPSIYDLSREQLAAQLGEWDQPAYRAGQIWGWLYHRLASSFDEMTNVPSDLRRQLAAAYRIEAMEHDVLVRSADGSTRKALFRLADGQSIETVLMEYAASEHGRGRATVCVSTQAGCAMACVFCATGQQGFVRNLTSGEIVGQVVQMARLLRAEGGHLTNLVFMGMGEPLANYDQTMHAIRTLADPDGFALGQRRMTLSTVGLVPMIRRFAREGLQVGLAISLHTPDDEQRRRLVPTARNSVREIIGAAREWSDATGRRFSVEYALVDQENDHPEQAEALAGLLSGVPCHVNLIPVNPTANANTPRSRRSRVLAFQRVLQERGINTTVRVEKGIDIAAGCGQLRGEVEGRRGIRAEPVVMTATLSADA
ncbi:MAG: 23S rRNA (adenine(2503)-C(2))-methyltransferase RlmN [Dehalococcoidia bacterium]